MPQRFTRHLKCSRCHLLVIWPRSWSSSIAPITWTYNLHTTVHLLNPDETSNQQYACFCRVCYTNICLVVSLPSGREPLSCSTFTPACQLSSTPRPIVPTVSIGPISVGSVQVFLQVKGLGRRKLYCLWDKAVWHDLFEARYWHAACLWLVHCIGTLKTAEVSRTPFNYLFFFLRPLSADLDQFSRHPKL